MVYPIRSLCVAPSVCSLCRDLGRSKQIIVEPSGREHELVHGPLSDAHFCTMECTSVKRYTGHDIGIDMSVRHRVVRIGLWYFAALVIASAPQ